MHIAVSNRKKKSWPRWTVVIAVFIAVFIFPIYPATNPFGARANAETLGQTRSFSIDQTYDAFGRGQINATLRDMSDHAYFYVEDNYWNSLGGFAQNLLSQNIFSLKNEFETVMYPKDTAFFGSEPNPGIDGDPRIYIML